MFHILILTAALVAAANGAAAAEQQLFSGVPDTWRGVGIEFRDEQPVIARLMEHMNAEAAGVRVGDRVLAIAGEPVATSREAIAKIKIASPSPVRLTVQAPGAAPREVEVAPAAMTDVRWTMLEDGVAYLRIRRFDDDSATHLRAAIRQARVRGARAWVLDLCSNAGGSLDATVAVARLFLDRGTIVTVRGRRDEAAETYEAHGPDVLHNMPLVVTIDARTNGAAEIVAAALRDNGRAKLVGLPSFGDSALQAHLPVPGKDGMRLVVARAYTPTGASFQRVGIKPDVELDAGASYDAIQARAEELVRAQRAGR
ncbi:S41 family peptidase [Roseiterribacter gracilis]|uniref:PDZ domain-containing protein n=1 Tax=Roseiterribacter gracilis TaxID=2812848 RepID=A0A8S8XFK1_9PROT|nr:hypothetical protein TMPK1_30190 [Rhodospirillales bacterium TMPK1]